MSRYYNAAPIGPIGRALQRGSKPKIKKPLTVTFQSYGWPMSGKSTTANGILDLCEPKNRKIFGYRNPLNLDRPYPSPVIVDMIRTGKLMGVNKTINFVYDSENKVDWIGDVYNDLEYQGLTEVKNIRKTAPTIQESARLTTINLMSELKSLEARQELEEDDPNLLDGYALIIDDCYKMELNMVAAESGLYSMAGQEVTVWGSREDTWMYIMDEVFPKLDCHIILISRMKEPQQIYNKDGTPYMTSETLDGPYKPAGWKKLPYEVGACCRYYLDKSVNERMITFSESRYNPTVIDEKWLFKSEGSTREGRLIEPPYKPFKASFVRLFNIIQREVCSKASYEPPENIPYIGGPEWDDPRYTDYVNKQKELYGVYVAEEEAAGRWYK